MCPEKSRALMVIRPRGQTTRRMLCTWKPWLTCHKLSWLYTTGEPLWHLCFPHGRLMELHSVSSHQGSEWPPDPPTNTTLSYLRSASYPIYPGLHPYFIYTTRTLGQHPILSIEPRCYVYNPYPMFIPFILCLHPFPTSIPPILGLYPLP